MEGEPRASTAHLSLAIDGRVALSYRAPHSVLRTLPFVYRSELTSPRALAGEEAKLGSGQAGSVYKVPAPHQASAPALLPVGNLVPLTGILSLGLCGGWGGSCCWVCFFFLFY